MKLKYLKGCWSWQTGYAQIYFYKKRIRQEDGIAWFLLSDGLAEMV